MRGTVSEAGRGDAEAREVVGDPRMMSGRVPTALVAREGGADCTGDKEGSRMPIEEVADMGLDFFEIGSDSLDNSRLDFSESNGDGDRDARMLSGPAPTALATRDGDSGMEGSLIVDISSREESKKKAYGLPDSNQNSILTS